MLEVISSALHQWNVSIETCETCDSWLCIILSSASKLVPPRASARPQMSAVLASHSCMWSHNTKKQMLNAWHKTDSAPAFGSFFIQIRQKWYQLTSVLSATKKALGQHICPKSGSWGMAVNNGNKKTGHLRPTIQFVVWSKFWFKKLKYILTAHA